MRRYTYDDLSVLAEKLLPYIKTDRNLLFIKDPDDKEAHYWIQENLPDFRFIINRMLEGIGGRTMEDLINLLRAYTVRDSIYQLNASDQCTLFENGIYDITSGCSATDSNAMFSYRVPHKLNLRATSREVDNFLQLISCGDPIVEKAILALGGAAITGYNPDGRLFFLIDDGFGGSTIIEKLLLIILGEATVSTLMLTQFGQRFYPAAIMGKRANIGAIGCKEIPFQTKEIIKSIAKGTLPITLEQKGAPVNGETVAPVLIFHGTEIPSIPGRDNWFTGKSIAIPFRSSICDGKDGIESHYIRKLSTEANVQYLIRRMLNEIHDVYISGDFPVPLQSKDEFMRLKIKRDPVGEYIKAKHIVAKDLADKPLSAVTSDIDRFLFEHEIEPLGTRAVSTKLKIIFPELNVYAKRLSGSDGPCKCFRLKDGVDNVRS